MAHEIKFRAPRVELDHNGFDIAPRDSRCGRYQIIKRPSDRFRLVTRSRLYSRLLGGWGEWRMVYEGKLTDCRTAAQEEDDARLASQGKPSTRAGGPSSWHFTHGW